MLPLNGPTTQGRNGVTIAAVDFCTSKIQKHHRKLSGKAEWRVNPKTTL